MNEYLEKLRSIGAPRRSGSAREVVERHDSATIITTEHWDGRKDTTVRPDTTRFEAVAHTTGRKRGQIADVRQKGASA